MPPHPPVSRWRRVVVAVALLAVLAPSSRALTGGPDRYGYTWRDSAEPGVVYAWEDIAATGNDVTIRDDDANTGLLALSFPFPYRGESYGAVAACTNGWASLVDTGSVEYRNGGLPDAGQPRGTLAPFWDDFNLTDTGRMVFQDLGDRAVISWIDAPDYDDTSLTATFQLVLFADGRIRSQLAAITTVRDSATIGIESVDDTDGLTAWRDGAIPVPPYAVEFVPPAPIPTLLDCANANPLSCGDVIEADLAMGEALQDAYRCLPGDWSGREHVYLVDFTTPTTARFRFEVLSGAPQMIVVPACEPNRCLQPPIDFLSFNGATGQYWLVIDSAPGQEGQYRLSSQCLPMATDLACATPLPLSCGSVVRGDQAAGVALQDAYWCSLADYSGREQVYLLDVPVQLPSLTLTLTPLSGSPEMIVVYPCDANACLAAPGLAVTLPDAVGPYFVVVDSAAADEGAFEIAVTGGAPPAREVGGALRVVGHGPGRAELAWPTAPVPRPGETYVVLRSEDSPAGPFEIRAQTRATSWTDPAAPERFSPVHLWSYVVLLSDPCGNLSAD